MDFVKKFLSPATIEKVRSAVLFRAEDPNFLMQIMPAKWQHNAVERIKGFRYPSPGSQPNASVPVRESEDDIYNTNFYPRDPRNLKTGHMTYINTSSKPAEIPTDKPNLPLYGYKRKITPMAYDSSGLRTTKTATWAAVDEVLAKRAVPDHLPQPSWYDDRDEVDAARARKGLPPAVGRVMKPKEISENFNQVRW